MALDVVDLGLADAESALAVVNDAARAYRGRIPPESDTRPYLAMDELRPAFEKMTFLGAVEDRLVGIVGLQERGDVSLVRHLYVRPDDQRRGVGSALLDAALDRAHAETVLVGTWRAADWAVAFYRHHGFELLGTDEALLSRYWDLPDHQLEASVVLRYEP